MKIYIKRHPSHAGKWIYHGYSLAWKKLGYETIWYNKLDDIKDKGYQLMVVDSDISRENLPIIEKASRAYVFVQPNTFPQPWGRHPNFISHCSDVVIQKINEMDNTHLWTFADCKSQYYYKWKQVKTIPLAYDSESYDNLEDKRFSFDVCYIGGRANNGFDEKYKIMLQHFEVFQGTKLKCGFFIDKDLTHEQENKILYNSKVSLNIHDAYQRTFGLDTNERTFKALGQTGVLVSDQITQLGKLFPHVKMSSDPKEMLKIVEEYVSIPQGQLNIIKENNRRLILEEHTYINRAKRMLKL